MSAVPQAQEPVLLREDRDGICTLTLNRPQQMNLLTSEMLAALQDAFNEISSNREIRVVVIAATGKGFCAGHDLKEIRALKELPKIEALFSQCSRMMATIPKLPRSTTASRRVRRRVSWSLVTRVSLPHRRSHRWKRSCGCETLARRLRSRGGCCTSRVIDAVDDVASRSSVVPAVMTSHVMAGRRKNGQRARFGRRRAGG